MNTCPGCIEMGSPAMLSAVIRQIDGSPHAFAIPLYRAALAGDLKLALLAPGGRVPARVLDHTRPPTVIVVSGDPASGGPAPAPEAFPQARRLLAWSAAVMLHASGGAARDYEAVADAARLVRRVLLIETATAQEAAWYDLVRGEEERRNAAGRHLPALIISAKVRGGVHPVAEGTR
ncbi:hypothetical protein M0638_20465 [Roseomonas sp. NAR14]|uniref:Uncharacterized protein n=1 Tax=Roseomonas acroporae TaxID=2937791 RepID=A0A9X2BY95_9PROT|nr:hypothetical protein [Roseomonas acroporae]MCK8786749.1 hypothetical protein [Roseomonas acroporae]